MKMRGVLKSSQLVHILLYLQFFAHNVYALNVDISSGITTSDSIDTIAFNEWECNADIECTATGSTCKNRQCQCSPGYILNSDMTSCIKVTTSLLEPCTDTLQCSKYLRSGGKCIDNICVCGPGFYYLHGGCNRYVGLHERCMQNITNCYVNADFEASTCQEGICKCSPGFYQREYRTCRRRGKVGEECMINLDCKDSHCNDEFRCVKTPDKIDSTKSKFEDAIELSNDTSTIDTFTDDVLLEIRVGSNCTVKSDCETLGNAECGPTGTCHCARAHFASKTGVKCIAELGELCDNARNAIINNSICRDGRWSCTNGTVASKTNRECLPVSRDLEKNGCNSHEQCYIFGPDSECRNEKCVCNEKSHYVPNELFCWGNRGIGETCVNDHDCYVNGFKGKLVCNREVAQCNCPSGKYLNKKKTKCIDGKTELGGDCEEDEECVTANSVCDKKKCTCDKNYFQSKNQCLPGINSVCTKNQDCKSTNSKCISGKCSCKPNYVAVATDSCLPILSYGKKCSWDIQCSANVSGAICMKFDGQSDRNIAEWLNTSKARNNGICICSQEKHYRFGKCLKKRLLGETCKNIGECYVSGNKVTVMCMNEKCTCSWGYAKWNSSVCVKDTRAVLLVNDATNVMSTGLLSIVLLAFSCNFF